MHNLLAKKMTHETDISDPQQTLCFHCGLDIPAGVEIKLEILNDEKPMCCTGCAAVAQAIVDAGQASFYQHRTEYSSRAQDLVPDFLQDLKIYNNPEIQKSFVSHRDQNTREASLLLEGISCAACIWLNEKHLMQLPGIVSVQVNYATHRAQIAWDNQQIELSDILAAIRTIGYQAHPYDPDQQQALLCKERKSAIRRIGIAGILGMQVMMLAVALYLGDWMGMEDKYRVLFNWAGLLLVLPILIYSANPFFSAALRDIGHLRVGMDVPVTLGLSIAFIASVITTFSGQGEVYYDSVAMFVFFLSTARFFELTARMYSADVNERISRVTPASACVLNRDSGLFETIAVAELTRGDEIKISAGQIIPADGVIVDGISGINESLLTGESLPRLCQPGDKVIAGSINADSPLRVTVAAVGQETVLSNMLRLMERAQNEKPMIAIMANRIAAWFVLFILLVASIAGLGWYFAGSERWLAIVISLLVVTCPCALSLATPVAITTATGALVSTGLLLTRGTSLETLSKVTDFSFDKTGTLTDGELNLLQIVNLSEYPDAELLKLAAALEQDSEHLLGKALVGEAIDQGLEFLSICVESSQHYPGQGVAASLDGQALVIGNSDFVKDRHKINISDQTMAQINRDGASVVLLANESCVLAAFLLGDEVRQGAAELIEELGSANVEVHLLTGDTEEAALRVAKSVGIKDIKFRLSPQQKLEQLQTLQRNGKVVAMLGDGINDAVVLGGADVSVAMGTAAQLSKLNSDVVLVSNSLFTLIDGLRHANKTERIIRQNLYWALIYNIVAIPVAAAGYIAPWMAAIGMSLSSLLVVLNSARLRKL